MRTSTIVGSVLVSLTVLSGCGSTSSSKPDAVPAPVTRHHGQWTFTVKWGSPAVAYKPLKATLHIKPAQGVKPAASAVLNMPDMRMKPVDMSWHKVKPGVYSSSAVLTMGGPWDLYVTFHHGSQKFKVAFPFQASNS